MATEDVLITSSVHQNLTGASDEAALGIVRDHVAKAYLGHWGSQEVTERVRNRIYWMARQAHGTKILDVGTSEGILALLLARERHEVLAIDLNDEAIAYANELRAKETPDVQGLVRFEVANFLDHEFDERFDTIVLGEVIEHLVDVEAVLEKAVACLNAGGRLIITTPMGLLPSSDHKQTFLLSRLVELVRARLTVTHVSVESGYIRLVAERRADDAAGDSAGAADVSPVGLLALTERALVDAQRGLWAVLDERREKLTRLTADCKRLKQAARTSEERRTALEQRVATLDEERRTLDAALSERRSRDDQMLVHLRERERENAKIREELQAVEQHEAAMEEQLAAREAELDEARRAGERLEARRAALQDEIGQTRRQMSAMESATRMLPAELEALRKREAELRASVARLQAPANTADVRLWTDQAVCNLESQAIRTCFAVEGGASYALTGRYVGDVQVGERDALVVFEYLDAGDRVLEGNYPDTSQSPQVGRYRYLPPNGNAREFVLRFTAPAGARHLRLSFRRWSNQAKLRIGATLRLETTSRAEETADVAARAASAELESAVLEAQRRMYQLLLDRGAADGSARVVLLHATGGLLLLTPDAHEVRVTPHATLPTRLEGWVCCSGEEERNKALAYVRFLDAAGREIDPEETGMNTNAKLGAYAYLPTGSGDCRLRIDIPRVEGAAELVVGFKTWGSEFPIALSATLLVSHPKPEKPKPVAAPAAGRSAKPVFQAVERPQREPRRNIKMAAIMDEFTRWCFEPECRLQLVHPDNWKEVLSADRPDLLFVESAWNGNDGAWQYMLRRPEPIRSGPVFELVAWCKQQRIPTVFWNKEDPPHFEDFIHAAALFDHVFTTDANCIPRYRERLGHNRVYALPFAVQPAFHNPIGTQRKLVGDVCFAGTYYARRHEKRQGEMDILLKAGMRHNLHIFDRMYGTTDERYLFPAEYRPAVRGKLSYREMLDAYKRYPLFLNVNSVANSPTMFSRRVLELLACGTPVVSTYAEGLERQLGAESVALVRTEEDAVQWIDLLMRNPDLRDRMVLRAQRRIFREHTSARRVATILESIGRPQETSTPRVTVITCTNRPQNLETLIANYERQAHPEKEFVLVLNSDEFSLPSVRERLATVANARVIQLPESCTLGHCLNAALDEMNLEYWSKFDDDNYYGANFLSDLLLPFEYTEASAIGKYTYYSYHGGPGCLALRYPGHEHQYVTFLSGSALIVDRRVSDEIRFPDKNRGEDTQFLNDAVERGYKLYSADRFNYVVRRSARVEDHTWQISDAEFLRHCRIVAYADDFRRHVVV